VERLVRVLVKVMLLLLRITRFVDLVRSVVS